MMLFNPKTQSSKSPAGPEAAIQVKQPSEIQARLAKSVQHSIIPDGMQISGDLVSTGDINVKGKIEGKIEGKTILNIRDKPKIDNLDTLTLYINRFNQFEWHDYLLALKPKRIIFNPGAENQELNKLARENGIETIEACTLVMLQTGSY